MSNRLEQALIPTNRNTLLTGKRRWAAVPMPYLALESAQEVLVALKSRAHTQARETGDILDSFISVRDLITLGVIDIEGRINTEVRIQSLEDIDTGITTVADLITALNATLAALRGDDAP